MLDYCYAAHAHALLSCSLITVVGISYLLSVAAALKSSSGNSEENKVIRVVHYFMTRLARAAPGALVEVRFCAVLVLFQGIAMFVNVPVNVALI